ASSLDEVPGLGEVRRKALLRHFGSVKKLAAASVEEIASVPGVGPRTAAAILTALSGEATDGRTTDNGQGGDTEGREPPAGRCQGDGEAWRRSRPPPWTRLSGRRRNS